MDRCIVYGWNGYVVFFSILLLQTFVIASFASVFSTHLRAEVSNQSDLSPLLESFVSKGDRFRGSVSSKNRNLSNWASFGYYTGWLLHCDWSQKGEDGHVIGRCTESCRDS